MYFQDLSYTQLSKIVKMLKQELDVIDSKQNSFEKEEQVDDWLNRNNDKETVLACLKRVYHET